MMLNEQMTHVSYQKRQHLLDAVRGSVKCIFEKVAK